MRKERILCMLCLLFIGTQINAQLKKAVQDLFESDTIQPVTVVAPVNNDSIRLQEMKLALDSAKLNEADLRMEMELLKMQANGFDSIKLAQQKVKIDSLRSLTTGVPVVVEGDTLFYLYAKRGGLSPRHRAQISAQAIETLGRKFNLHPDSVYIENSDIVSDIMYENLVLVSFTDQDGLWANSTREQLAAKERLVIVDKLRQLNEEHGTWQMTKRFLYFILVLIGQYILFRLTNWLYRRLKVRISRLRNTRLKAISIQDYELLNTQKQVKLLVFLANIGRYILMGLQLLITVPLLFSIFPQTKSLAYTIFSYIWDPIKSIFFQVVNYIPNLFTIIVIYYAVRYLVKGVHYLATEIESERLKIQGFYADWAVPTYHIFRFLLYAFMLAMIYPYLPGSDSGVFQGISVFVGLIISLGSSTVIGNIIAGLVITYMRAFKIGDRIQLNETTGNVVEKTPLVTRIRTPKNELVTIPNSFIMSSHTVNFSASAREYGLIIHTEITCGYETPWRKVHELLIEAARVTPGVETAPSPFVLETALSDNYPVYQINAYVTDVEKLAQVYSDLYQNIQDKFYDAGIEMTVPHYTAVRNGNASTLPKDDLRSGGSNE